MDPQQMIGNLLPTREADNGSACMNCMKASDHLVRCAACRRVKYCGKACQQKNWKEHKPVCKIMQAFKGISLELPTGSSYGYGKHGLAKTFVGLKSMANDEGNALDDILPKNAGEKTWAMARKLTMASPCCAICNKTDYDKDLPRPIEWKCCSTCKYGWTCAEHHEEYMASVHTAEICSNYVEHSKIELFRYNHTVNHGDRFMFMPEQALSMPMRSFPSNWDQYFQIRCPNEYSMRRHLPEEFFTASTFLLSQVNTVLYGMYRHGKDQFTSLNELTIHVIGAAMSFEYEGGSPTYIWEEIMHCLPSVKTLKIIFVGPEGKLNRELFPIEACPDCISKGRVRMQAFHDLTYHDYRASDDFITPDFAAAFNTGMYDEYTESWKESLAVLLDLQVPCIFTSFNKEEGEEDLKVLQDVGAKTLTNKTNLNPFHVNIPFIDDNYIDKFFYHNMYYICFKGREE